MIQKKNFVMKMNVEEIKNESNSRISSLNTGQKVMKLFFLVHLYVYMAVNLLLLGINLVGWQGFAWFPLPLIGWGIGLALHHTLYRFCIMDDVNIMDAIFILHGVAYAMVNCLLIYINISSLWYVYNFWFLLPLFGWGIGLTIHATGNKLLKSSEKSTAEMIFILHLVAYGIVNFFLIYINVSLLWFSLYLWFLYPLILWSIGIMIHAIATKIIVDNKLSGDNLTKLINKTLLVTNIIYYAVVNITLLLLGVLLNPQVYTATLFSWPLAIALHSVYIGLFDYVERIAVSIKGVIFHLAIYIASFPIAIINSDLLNPFVINWAIFAALVWVVAIGVHLVIAIIWERTDHSLKVLNSAIFLVHLIAYTSTIIALVILNITIFTGPLWSVVAALGWLIGLSEHFTIYLCYEKDRFSKLNFKGFLKISTYLHLSAYISVAALLIWINLSIGGFLWFIIAMAGWGIGLGPHLIIENLVNNK